MQAATSVQNCGDQEAPLGNLDEMVRGELHGREMLQGMLAQGGRVMKLKAILRHYASIIDWVVVVDLDQEGRHAKATSNTLA